MSQFIKDTHFRKELSKSSQTAGWKKCVSLTAIAKLPANLLILTIAKFENQNLSKANNNVF